MKVEVFLWIITFFFKSICSPVTTPGPDSIIVPPLYPDEVTFYLFTSKYYSDKYERLNPNMTETFNHLHGKIYFMTHGWKETRGNASWFKPVTETLLKKYPYANIIQIDWRKPGGYEYNVSIKMIPEVGGLIGDMTAKIDKSNTKPKEIVFLGNSLGGQLIAFAAKRFKKLTGSKVSRIVSLDPAGFVFNTSVIDKRLNPEDAENVVVVHTDQIFGWGNFPPIGTIDFYPNGGVLQPGCPPIPPYNFTYTRPGVKDPIWCPHVRAIQYFEEAIKSPEHFIARKCQDYNSFKEGNCENVRTSLGDLETRKKGLFFLDTAGQRPFYVKQIDSAKKSRRT